MATDDGPCCGHDHVGGDELWLTVDELTNLIDSAVDAALALPRDATRERRRAAIRDAYQRQEQQQAAAPQPAARPMTRGQRHDEWARRLWGQRG